MAVAFAKGVDNDPANVERTIEKVSSDRRFIYPERKVRDPFQKSAWTEKFEEWMQSIQEWLADLFGDVVIDPSEGAVTPPIISMTSLVYLLYGLAACALIYIVYRVILHHYPRFRTRLADETVSAEDLVENLDPGGRLSLAEQLIRDGKWAEALSALMISLLLIFDARGLVRYHRSRTSREYLRSIRRYPVLFSLTNEFVLGFEQMKFGHRIPDKDGTMYLFDLYRQAEDAVPVSSRDPQPDT